MKCALAFDDTLKMSVIYSCHCHSALICFVHVMMHFIPGNFPIFTENHGFKVKCVMMMVRGIVKEERGKAFFGLTLIHLQLMVLPLIVTVKCHFEGRQ